MPFTPVASQPRFPGWLLAALLMLGTIAVYWPATRCDFVGYDDPEFLTENPHVQRGLNWPGLKWALCNTEQAAYWAPLMWLSHMLAWQFFGMNAWGHHLINVLLHAANTTLVFLVFRRLTGATWRSLMVAALFGWHPLRVESVAWVTERKDVLSMLFWIMALWAYAKYVEAAPVRPSKSNLWYGAALGMFVLGLMSKPVLVVTLPCVLLLLDYWPLGRRQKAEASDTPHETPVLRSSNAEGGRNTPHVSRFTLHAPRSTMSGLVREKIPFFFLAAMASVMTFMAQKQGGALTMNEQLPLGARLGNALISYCSYLGKLFWPKDMAVFYPHPGHWPLEEVLLAGGGLLGISVLLVVQRRRYPFLLMGWLWFCGTLVPVIQLVSAGGYAMADRFTYVPSLGVLILAIWGACEVTRRRQHQVLELSVAGGAAIVLCLALTRQQLGYWRDSETLFRHALAVTERNHIAHNNLGAALERKGQIDEAISQYQEAIRLKPDDANARYNLGSILLKTGQIDEAISQFQEAIRLKPDDADAHYNLGLALDEKGQIEGAISQYREAIRLKPNHADAHNNLGNTLEKKGQIDEAISQYQEAIRLTPDRALAHNNLGHILIRIGQIDEAISQLQAAIRLKSDFAEAHNNLGAAFGKKDQTDEAIRQFQEALRLKPDQADVQDNLAKALELQSESKVRTSDPVKP